VTFIAPDGKNVTNVQETRRGGSPIDQTGSNQRRAKVMVCDLGGFTWVNFRSNMRAKLARSSNTMTADLVGG
jgi:hypothetical protein